ncbi:hormone-sensitive lipase [Anaeramoeba flamelloides]|uniref:Hormone-sensitive lipase n=1 Tax=Anaeramoeba flamelloides TaxID=1746091 RepID=A0ABQ8Z7D8_9EUKA|nr:hormone-sensitive lipase [Anaeramoeba flamelloides]
MTFQDWTERLGFYNIFHFIYHVLLKLVGLLVFRNKKALSKYKTRKINNEYLECTNRPYERLITYEKMISEVNYCTEISKRCFHSLKNHKSKYQLSDQRVLIISRISLIQEYLKTITIFYQMISKVYPLEEAIRSVSLNQKECGELKKKLGTNCERLGPKAWSLYALNHSSYQTCNFTVQLLTKTPKELLSKSRQTLEDLEKSVFLFKQLSHFLVALPNFLGFEIGNYDFKSQLITENLVLQKKQNAKETIFQQAKDLPKSLDSVFEFLTSPRKVFHILEWVSDLKKTVHQLNVSWGAVKYCDTIKNSTIKLISYLITFCCFYCRPKHCKKLASHYKSKSRASLHTSQFVFNLMETQPTHFFIYFPLLSVPHECLFWIPANTTPKSNFFENSNQIDKIKNGKANLTNNKAKNHNFNYYTRIKFPNSIQIRYFSQFPMNNSLKRHSNPNWVNNTVIFHAHGGGFIAQSSYTHSPYLKKWCNKAGASILSVDYTNAPEGEFPTPLIEVYTAYRWLLENLSLFVNPKKKHKIVVAGDSAGGNLLVSMIIKLISEGNEQLLPDAAILAYPVINLSDDFSLSRMLFCEGPFMSEPVLKLCLDNYHKPDSKTEQNEYISPILTNDEILKKFPKCLIQVGLADSLLDDSCYFADKLQSLGRDVQFHVYCLPHTFLSLEMLILGAKIPNKHIIEFIRKLDKN